MSPTILLSTTKHWVPTARLAASLSHAGFRVEALCPSRHPIGEARAASRIHTYRGLAPLRSLAQALASSQPDLIVPGDDLALAHVHEIYRLRKSYVKELPELAPLIERSLGLPEAFPILQARAAFMDLARAEGVRIPETAAIGSSEEVRNWVERAGFPTVFKADGTSGGEGVRIVGTAAEAQRAFRQLQAPPLLARALKRAVADQDRTLLRPAMLRQRAEVSAQAWVAGYEATSTIACWKGEVLASLHFGVLRKGNAAGHATVVRRIENIEMSMAVAKLVGRMRLSGFCGFDFMLEADTGHAYLIEINARATQVGHLTLGPGRDLPAALYAAATGHPIATAPALTRNETIALFPHEWARDPQSEFLRTAYHDVPWDMPELVRSCVRRSRQQSAWYSSGGRKQKLSATAAHLPQEKMEAEKTAAGGIAAQSVRLHRPKI